MNLIISNEVAAALELIAEDLRSQYIENAIKRQLKEDGYLEREEAEEPRIDFTRSIWRHLTNTSLVQWSGGGSDSYEQ